MYQRSLKKPEYVYHEEFAKQQELLEEYEMFSKKLPHGYKVVTVLAGDMMELRVSPVFKRRCDYSRGARYACSSETQKKLNNANAQAKVVILVNSNFTNKDAHLTAGWTFEEMPDSLKEAKRRVKLYIERIRYHIKKTGKKKLKYVYFIESVAGNVSKGEPVVKYHVHFIIGVRSGKIDLDLLVERWNGGAYPKVGRLILMPEKGLTGMALYFSKQMNDMGDPAEPNVRRWEPSEGLKKYTRKPSTNYKKFSKKKIISMATTSATLKEEFEKAYPDYVYSEEFPCKPQYNKVVGGFYLHCRMYRKRE